MEMDRKPTVTLMSKPADLSQFQVEKPTATPDQPTPQAPTTATPTRKMKGFRVRINAAKQLAMLKIETDKDEQDLMAEALNLLFEKYGKPPIA